MIADVFTKALPRPRFEILSKLLMEGPWDRPGVPCKL